MQLIRGLSNLSRVKSQLASGCVLTIGNFDGLHLGHQQILNSVIARATALNLPSVVMLFEPLPIEFFSPKNAPVRLMNFREKLRAFEHTAVDYVLCVRFNAAFAQLSKQAFVNEVLIDGLHVKHLVVGDDFRFGQQRQGDFAYLLERGAQAGFSVTDMPTFLVDGHRVSSTRIRDALACPDLPEAQRLLGKAFSFNGRVIHGQKLGRTLGFRTLNLNPKRTQMPVQGVYAVLVHGLNKQPWPGVANVGLRPTVDGQRPSIEVHLFNWHADVYGQHVEVALQAFIRCEMKFASLESLKAQIQHDAQQAKDYFGLA
jgi:riboflavin kinase/FMN adenylyltransferase